MNWMKRIPSVLLVLSLFSISSAFGGDEEDARSSKRQKIPNPSEVLSPLSEGSLTSCGQASNENKLSTIVEITLRVGSNAAEFALSDLSTQYPNLEKLNIENVGPTLESQFRTLGVQIQNGKLPNLKEVALRGALSARNVLITNWTEEDVTTHRRFLPASIRLNFEAFILSGELPAQDGILGPISYARSKDPSGWRIGIPFVLCKRCFEMGVIKKFRNFRNRTYNEHLELSHNKAWMKKRKSRH